MYVCFRLLSSQKKKTYGNNKYDNHVCVCVCVRLRLSMEKIAIWTCVWTCLERIRSWHTQWHTCGVFGKACRAIVYFDYHIMRGTQQWHQMNGMSRVKAMQHSYISAISCAQYSASTFDKHTRKICRGVVGMCYRFTCVSSICVSLVEPPLTWRMHVRVQIHAHTHAARIFDTFSCQNLNVAGQL